MTIEYVINENFPHCLRYIFAQLQFVKFINYTFRDILLRKKNELSTLPLGYK